MSIERLRIFTVEKKENTKTSTPEIAPTMIHTPDIHQETENRVEQHQTATTIAKSEIQTQTQQLQNDINTNNIKLSPSAEKTWNHPVFQKEMQAMCQRLGINPEHLKIVMNKESKINPQARNKSTNATGLIQFMPDTALKIGTSVNALYKMSAVEQLKYVEKFYKPYKGKLNTAGELYLATFYPLALSKGDNFILGSERSAKYAKIVAQQNPGIAKFSNTQAGITKAAFERYVYA